MTGSEYIITHYHVYLDNGKELDVDKAVADKIAEAVRKGENTIVTHRDRHILTAHVTMMKEVRLWNWEIRRSDENGEA